FKGLIPIREALAESRNAVAIWITEQVGFDSVLRTAQPRRPDSIAALCDDGVGCVRSELAGAGDGLPNDCIRRPRAAVRDSAHRPGFGRADWREPTARRAGGDRRRRAL